MSVNSWLGPRGGFSIGDCRVETGTRTVSGPNGATSVGPRAMAVLATLAANAGEITTTREILERAWPDATVGVQVVSNAVWQVRRAFSAAGGHGSEIETVTRVGYRLTEPAIADPPHVHGVPRIAVIPLANLTGDPDRHWLVDGLTGALTDELAAVGGLEVIAAATMARYRSDPAPPSDVARQLAADWLVTGAVRLGGGRLRVTVQLVNPSEATVAWQASRERTLEDVLSLQVEIAREIARGLGTSLGAAESDPVVPPQRSDPIALECALRGRTLVRGGGFDDLEQGLIQLNEAARRWPDAAAVHADLARAHYTLARWGRAPGGELLEAARAAADRALELEPGLVPARVIAELVEAALQWIFSDAAFRLARLVADHPGDPELLDGLARCVAATGRIKLSLRLVQRALGGDPLSPGLNTTLGFLLRAADRPHEAVAQLKTSLAIAPGSAAATAELGRAYRDCGAVDDAVSVFASSQPDWSRFLAATARGDRSEITRQLDTWLDPSAPYQAPYWLAERCIWADRHDLALDCLERAYREHQVQLMFVAIEPTFSPIRNEPRFVALLQRTCRSGHEARRRS